MADAFISHSSKDQSFVMRLVEILNEHGVSTWSSAHDLVGGDDWRNKIQHELDTARTLIILVSKNSEQSEWVRKEIEHFRSFLKRRVVPVRLDDTDAATVYSGLDEYQFVDFSSDHIQGYMTLLAIYEKSFMFVAEKKERRSADRRQGERRSGERRRSDRRSNDPLAIPRRLRRGFMNCYCEKSGESEKYELFLIRTSEMLKIQEHLNEEVSRYSFRDKAGEVIDAQVALETALSKSWETMREIRETVEARYLIDEIVADLVTNYQVTLIDRRTEDQRARDRRGNERRDG